MFCKLLKLLSKTQIHENKTGEIQIHRYQQRIENKMDEVVSPANNSNNPIPDLYF